MIKLPSEIENDFSKVKWTIKRDKNRKSIKVAFFPDLGTMDVTNGKPQGLDFSLILEWGKRNNTNIKWRFVSTAKEAISLVSNGLSDIAAGNIPIQDRPGLICSHPVREFNWIQFGDNDSLYLLKEYPKLSIALKRSDSLPLSTQSVKMWRHVNFKESGWLLPDYLASEISRKKDLNHHKSHISTGGFAWVVQNQDTTLIRSINKLIKDPKLNRIKNHFKRHNIKFNYFDFENISPYDQEFKNRTELDQYTLTALVFTESRFRSDIVSPAGAIGLMQVIPSTAKSLGIDSASLFIPKINIKAGLKYLRFLNKYWDLKGVKSKNRLPFILASYNVGPSRIAKAARKAKKLGLKPDLWYDNVDQIAKGPGAHYAERILKLANIYRGFMTSINLAKNPILN
ncbi:MAG: Membrane-bound lytic murein transglycosylase F [Owenweeksia sp. TMED14]|nr:MAG: Membrane-bound lytic murein transglycosylase F [Owenweeksia sp. TMED14]